MRLPPLDRFLIAAVLTLLAGIPHVVVAQFVDDFSDGEFTSNPAWIHSDTLWKVVPFEVDSALRTNGLSISDTLQISTSSAVAYGTWRFTFHFEGGQLTNFNQARIFLVSDGADVDQPVRGYQLQLGTNSRNVRLYRADPAVSGDRELLASSANDVIAGTEATLYIIVERSTDNAWTIKVDDVAVLTHTETTDVISSSSFFGLWVKHSGTRGQAYYFDDFDVSDALPPDITPPSLVGASYDAGLNTVSIDFSEALDEASVQLSDFVVDGGVGNPSSVELTSAPGRPPASTVRLAFTSTLVTGSYNITVSDLTDIAGNVIVSASVPLEVESDTSPPDLSEVTVIDPSTLRLDFSESLDPAGGCGIPENYDVSASVGSPASALCPAGGASTVRLNFNPPIPAGSYTLVVSNVADTAGNILVTDSAPFSIEFQGDVPQAGDLVVNEIFYDPPDTELEFVEFYNRSDKTFDLSEFELSDNRLAPTAITTSPFPVLPGAYAVVVRDADLFADVYPGVDAAVTASWPALNNTGDAVILSYGSLTVDSLVYDPSWGGSDVSIERRDPAGPSSRASNWSSSVAPGGATPGAENSIFGPDLSPPQLVFVEQAGSSSARYYFDEPLDMSTVSAGSFQVGAAIAQDVAVLGTEGSIVEAVFKTALAGGTASVSNVADLTGNVLLSGSAAFARMPQVRDIVINEIMFDPRADGSDGLQDQTEYIELVNNTTNVLTLSGLYWTDMPDEHLESDTVRFVGRPVGIAPGGYAVVFAQPEALAVDEIYTASSLVLAFARDYAADGTALLPVIASSLGLLNDGDVIHLHAQDGATLDSLRYEPGWHNPNLRDAKGVSLERLDPFGRSDQSRNWSSSVVVAGGTPGEPNSVFLSPEIELSAAGLQIVPSPFSPDSDGFEDVTAIGYVLDSAPALIRVRVFDSRGRLVRTLEEARLAGSTGNILWDGLDEGGEDVRIGIYIVLLEAIDTAGGRTEIHKAPVVVARPLE